jgi:hypothetical protein
MRILCALMVVATMLSGAGAAQAGLVAQYSFDGANPLSDETGSGNALTTGGSPATTFLTPPSPTFAISGTTASMYSGNGGCASTGHLNIPASVANAVSDFTVTMLVYKTSTVANHQTLLASDAFRFQRRGTEQLGVDTKSDGSGASTTGLFPDNAWRFVTLTYRASDNRMEGYIAPVGTSVGAATFAFNVTNENVDNAINFRLGSDGCSGIGCDDPFGGYIDHVRFYNDFKSQSQINAIFQRYVAPFSGAYSHEQASPLADDLGNAGHALTNAGGVTFTAPVGAGGIRLGQVAGTYNRDLGNSYLSVPADYNQGDDFTFTAFVRKTGSNLYYETILASDRFRLQYTPPGIDVPGSGALFLQLTASDGDQYSPAGSFEPDEWQFVAMRYNASTRLLEAFLQDPGSPFQGPVISFTVADPDGLGNMANFRIGSDGVSGIGGVDGFLGQIDEARMFTGYLSNAQIEAIFTSYIPEPSASILLSLGALGIAAFARGSVRRRPR